MGAFPLIFLYLEPAGKLPISGAKVWDGRVWECGCSRGVEGQLKGLPFPSQHAILSPFNVAQGKLPKGPLML